MGPARVPLDGAVRALQFRRGLVPADPVGADPVAGRRRRAGRRVVGLFGRRRRVHVVRGRQLPSEQARTVVPGRRRARAVPVLGRRRPDGGRRVGPPRRVPDGRAGRDVLRQGGRADGDVPVALPGAAGRRPRVLRTGGPRVRHPGTRHATGRGGRLEEMRSDGPGRFENVRQFLTDSARR